MEVEAASLASSSVPSIVEAGEYSPALACVSVSDSHKSLSESLSWSDNGMKFPRCLSNSTRKYYPSSSRKMLTGLLKQIGGVPDYGRVQTEH